MTGDDNIWNTVLAGIESPALDCLQANLALLADRFHGAGTHRRLGARLCFTPAFNGPFPTIDPRLAGRLDEAERLLGLRVQWRADRLAGDDLLQVADRSWPLFVVADGHELPWVPYFQRRHIEHSFLLLPGTVIDAYHIDAPEGSARPAYHPADEAAIAALTVTAIRFELAEPGPLEAIGVAPPEPGVIDAYVRAYRDAGDRAAALDRLSQETWLLARSRRLHARWAPDRRAETHADAWDSLAQAVYLAKRRVDRGRDEPLSWSGQLTDMLRAELEFAGDPAVLAEARSVISKVAAEVLGVDQTRLAAGSLADVPGFNSFRLVDIVERVEELLGLELPPDTLVAENLESLDKLAVLVARRTNAVKS